MNTSLSNLYAELAVSRVQLDEDDYILDLISKQLNQISEREDHAIVLIMQRRDRLVRDIRKLEKRIVELEGRW